MTTNTDKNRNEAREAAWKDFVNNRKDGETSHGESFLAGFDQGIDASRADWVDVNERLPEGSIRVFAAWQTESGEFDTGEIDFFAGKFQVYQGEWLPVPKVVAWMPIPPFKPTGTEGV